GFEDTLDVLIQLLDRACRVYALQQTAQEWFFGRDETRPCNVFPKRRRGTGLRLQIQDAAAADPKHKGVSRARDAPPPIFGDDLSGFGVRFDQLGAQPIRELLAVAAPIGLFSISRLYFEEAGFQPQLVIVHAG